jgi:hypothetical protein
MAMADILISGTTYTTGQKTSAQSIGVVLASDQPPVPIFSAGVLPSAVTQDILGTPRASNTLLFFTDTNTYGIDPEIWYSGGTTDTANGGSVAWVPNESAAQLLSAAAGNTNSKAILQTRQSFKSQPGTAVAGSFGVSIQNTTGGYPDNEINSVKEFGFSTDTDGFFVRVLGNGQGDNLQIIRRTSTSEATYNSPRVQVDYTASGVAGANQANRVYSEEVVLRSGFNADKMDGTLTGGPGGTQSQHTLTFRNLTMFRIDFAWPSCAKFYAFIPPIGNIYAQQPVWVLLHTISTADQLSYPSIGSPTLPLTFKIFNKGAVNCANAQVLKKYDTHVAIDGGTQERLDFLSVSVPNATQPALKTISNTLTPVLGIRVKAQVKGSSATGGGKSNLQQVFPQEISYAAQKWTEFKLIKNPTGAGGTTVTPTGAVWTDPSDFAAFEFDTSATDISTTAFGDVAPKVIATYYVNDGGADNAKLNNIFDYGKQILLKQAQSPLTSPGDVLYIAARTVVAPSGTCSASLVVGYQ